MKDDHPKSRRKRRKAHRKAWRNFWRAWRDERSRLWEESQPLSAETGRPRPPFPPDEMARHWRHFFHEFTGDWPEAHWAFGGRRFSPWHQGQIAFNPFIAGLLSKGGGLLPLFILHLLSQGPRYGNELMDQIVERTEGGWVANPGAIYPLMTQLEKRGLVEGAWEDPRKRTIRVYHLTATGVQELERLKAVVRPKLAEAIRVLQELTRELNGEDDETRRGTPPGDLI